MKAVVFHGIGDIRLEQVAEPTLQAPTDAIVRITSSAICGTDLHFIRGTVAGVKPGTILGHEGVGIVEKLGPEVRNLRIGDRVVIPSTIGCGNCSYCRAGYFAQCDNANPNGNGAGTAFYGGPETTGPFQGLQAEYARIPFANIGLVRLPEEISDEQAILLSDIFPTGYFGAELAEITPGDSVAVFGCGPVGIFAIISAGLFEAGRIIAVDCIESRLENARRHGAEVINFEREDPVEVIMELTGGIGVDRVIDAVGVDAMRPHQGPGAKTAEKQKVQFEKELKEVAPESRTTQTKTTQTNGAHWTPGDAPSQVLRWAVEVIAKAGTLSVVGLYPPQDQTFPIGSAAAKNLTINMGNCNHRRYIPMLLRLVKSGTVDPTSVLTKQESLLSAIDAYKSFDRREAGWMKVELQAGA